MTKKPLIDAVDCLTGDSVSVDAMTGAVLPSKQPVSGDLPYVGPGLTDLQVNGANGIDFNDTSLTAEKLLSAAEYLIAHGVTTFLPTVITNAEEKLLQLLKTIDQACRQHTPLARCIGGIHLEGPFISAADGARGAHDKQFVRAPDWDLFLRLQEAAGNRIKIITLSPEWDSAPAFISKCRKNDVLVSIGHSMASTVQVQSAVDAGATLSTHLGNGVPLLLARHPNIIWDQLAQETLSASFIADGFHVPDSFIRVLMKVKRERCFLVSDSTLFSGMRPGIYDTHIGGKVELEANGRLSVADHSGLLAGAAKPLLQNVEHLIGLRLASLAQAWAMASTIPQDILGGKVPGDKVLFFLKKNKIHISKVFKGGKVIHEAVD